MPFAIRRPHSRRLSFSLFSKARERLVRDKEGKKTSEKHTERKQFRHKKSKYKKHLPRLLSSGKSMQIELIFPCCWCKFDYSELLSKIDPKMRRYNSLNNSREDDSRDEADGSGGATLISDSGGVGRRNEEETPFTDYPVDEHARYKRTFCLVFTLFIGGLVSCFFRY